MFFGCVNGKSQNEYDYVNSPYPRDYLKWLESRLSASEQNLKEAEDFKQVFDKTGER